MLSQIDLIRLIQSELSRADQNSYLVTHNFLKLAMLPVLYSHINSTYVHLPSIFVPSFIFFFAIFALPRNFPSFCCRAFLNCKVACQSVSFKIKSQLYWQNSEKALRPLVLSLLSAEEELLILILIQNQFLQLTNCQCHSTYGRPKFLL